MKFFAFGCSKFKRLTSEGLDRSLTLAEQRFADKHRLACDSCRQMEQNQHLALNMLRASALIPDTQASFDRRVVRRFKVQSVRERFGYWSPAAVGATIATVLVLCLLQVVANPGGIPERKSPTGEARNDLPVLPSIPNLAPESSPQ